MEDVNSFVWRKSATGNEMSIGGDERRNVVGIGPRQVDHVSYKTPHLIEAGEQLVRDRFHNLGMATRQPGGGVFGGDLGRSYIMRVGGECPFLAAGSTGGRNTF